MTVINNGQELSEPVASLAVVDMEKLLNQDAESARCLLEAAKSPGFFFMNLQGQEFKDMVADVAALFDVSHLYFAQPPNEKSAHFRGDIERGYKSGKGHESLEVAREELEDSCLAFPGHLLKSHQPLLTRFAERSDLVAKAILHSLLGGLQMGNGNDKVDVTTAGDSSLKFISAPTNARRQDAPDTTHTDQGIITLLWCPQLSSQILDPRTKEWMWVEPLEGHVLVNVANALQEATGGQLHSCVHRVTQPKDGIDERHFISYYLRPGATKTG